MREKFQAARFHGFGVLEDTHTHTHSHTSTCVCVCVCIYMHCKCCFIVIREMCNICILSLLQATKEETQGLISKTTKLQAEGRMLAVQAEVAAAFLAKFQLQPKEEQALREPVTQEFFDALDRVKAIHDDVKILLRSNQQTAGLEIMEQMALHEEAAYERLYRWAQNDCRGLTRDSCDVSPLLIRALACLQPRPVLFKYVIDEFGAARRSAVVRCFIEALTRGGASGTPRPIEMHCHDPLR
uniref:Conserved oligomeric Golgi complex subunit 6 n=1 Tax=Eptatretus burgeri TaxID=7764 RepID=A0A8C4R0V2_EPTBU